MKGKTSMFVFIIVLGSILTTSLVGVDSYTKPIIEKNTELKRKASILKAFDIPYEEETIEQVFLDNVRGRGSGTEEYYMSTDLISFVFSGAGLWGPIEGVLAMDDDLREIQRITIMYQEETPGLGSRIAEAEFLDRFKDKSFTPGLVLVPEGKASSNNEIDSVTGATMSSEALIAILNTNYDKFSQLVSGE
jgi:Na+-transporting NADH:ubiquinone oxidoreductase subunit C